MNISIVSSEREDEIFEEIDEIELCNQRSTFSDRGGSPIMGKNMFEFKSPQIIRSYQPA